MKKEIVEGALYVNCLKQIFFGCRPFVMRRYFCGSGRRFRSISRIIFSEAVGKAIDKT